MTRPRARQLALVPLLGVAVLAYADVSAAYTCGAPRQLSPSNGGVLPSDGAIWDVCYYAPYGLPIDPAGGCEPPLLRDEQGNLVELVVEREIRSDRYGRVLTAYRPAQALTVGAHYYIEPIYFLDGRHEIRVGDLPETAPALPVVTAIDFSVHSASEQAFNARFTFQPFDGTLVVDSEGTLTDPFEGLEITEWGQQDEAPVFYLANEPCYINFEDARFGAPATVRFGVVDAAGAFSGWTEPVSIQFPTEETSYPEVEAMLAAANAPPDPVLNRGAAFANRGSCSLSSAHSAAARATSPGALTALALLTLAGVRRGRRGRRG